MLTFKIVRKIGKMLRGGAGRREIFLGALCGVLIGFNPVAGLTLAFAILAALLLNANLGFALLGVALGKALALALSAVSFHTGYFIIHNMGLEGLFTLLANAPVTALMDLDVYAMVGCLPYAIIIGIAFGKFMDTAVTKIREQMVKAGSHEKVGKAVGNKFSRFLMWLAFGKHKVSTADVLEKQSPLLRKSGLILVGSVVAFALLLEFLLLDLAVKSGLQSAISARTGAEVDIGKARLSLAGGKLEIENLQVADPDKPTHNLVQIDTLSADIGIGDLLRRTYTIELLAAGTLRRDVPRDKPGKLLTKAKPQKAKVEEEAREEESGKSLGDYFAKARDWEKYGNKILGYLQKRKANAEAIAKGEKPKPSKAAAVADAKKLGYLKAAADLVADRPAWTIRRVEIDQVLPGGGLPPQQLSGTDLSSHPELNGHPTTLAMTPAGGSQPSFELALHFENPAAMHELTVHFAGIAMGGAVETPDSFPVDVRDGKIDVKAAGTFSADGLAVPFTLLVHNLKAEVEEGRTVMGMDSKTATEVFSSMESIEIDGALGGTLAAPRVSIDNEKLAANMRQALVAAGKKELSKRANQEMDKAKDELMKQGGEELGKLLGGEDGQSTKDQAKGLLKKLF